MTDGRTDQYKLSQEVILTRPANKLWFYLFCALKTNVHIHDIVYHSGCVGYENINGHPLGTNNKKHRFIPVFIVFYDEYIHFKCTQNRTNLKLNSRFSLLALGVLIAFFNQYFHHCCSKNFMNAFHRFNFKNFLEIFVIPCKLLDLSYVILFSISHLSFVQLDIEFGQLFLYG